MQLVMNSVVDSLRQNFPGEEFHRVPSRRGLHSYSDDRGVLGGSKRSFLGTPLAEGMTEAKRWWRTLAGDRVLS
jgi:hypothetical protein